MPGKAFCVEDAILISLELIRKKEHCGTRVYPYCVNWLFEAHSLWRESLLGLDSGGGGLVPASNKVPEFFDSPWEALPTLRNGWRQWGTGVESKMRGGVGTGICK